MAVKMPKNAVLLAILAKKARENPIFCNYGPTTEQMFPFAGAGLRVEGSVSGGRERSAPERPLRTAHV